MITSCIWYSGTSNGCVKTGKWGGNFTNIAKVLELEAKQHTLYAQPKKQENKSSTCWSIPISTDSLISNFQGKKKPSIFMATRYYVKHVLDWYRSKSKKDKTVKLQILSNDSWKTIYCESIAHINCSIVTVEPGLLLMFKWDKVNNYCKCCMNLMHISTCSVYFRVFMQIL